MSVTKAMLVAEVARTAALPNAEATNAVEALLEAIATGAKRDGKVIIRGFGTFEMKTRPARLGRNPRTGETIEIAASSALTFRAAKPKT
jgi:DNA-binding protein HU-beta